jgi:hypothetical protein
LDPRPPYYEGGYYVAPVLKYFTKNNPGSQKEFLDVVSAPIVELLDSRGYESFHVGTVHIGYDRTSAVPCVVVCATDLTIDDAKSAISLFKASGCVHLHRLFCYTGITSNHVSETLSSHQPCPEIGSSIGVTGVDSSCSLGAYLHLSGKDEQFVLSVHHGVSTDTISITPLTSPPITVQQPSAEDVAYVRQQLMENLESSLKGPTPYNYQPPSDWEDSISDLDALPVDFGNVKYSEQVTVDYEGRQMWCDWCVIEASRSGSNYVTITKKDSNRWFPRGDTRLYLAGVDNLDVGSLVVKSGPSTGTTEGIISFIYERAKIKGTGRTTQEYSVYSTMFQSPFSELGESGSIVLNDRGMAVGMVLGGTVGKPMTVEGHEDLGSISLHYITPIKVILDRIEMVTGMEAQLDIPDLKKLEEGGTKIYRHKRDVTGVARS